ncbi:MAG: PAS domain S-box protein [Candidatus Sumerlaeia bacterium]|nr:PAS domain S-box protein [Candidatus Sumerlaeia bacterium]
MRSRVAMGSWAVLAVLLAACFAVWGAALVSRSAQVHTDALARIPLIAQIEESSDALDRMGAQLPLASERELLELLRGGRWRGYLDEWPAWRRALDSPDLNSLSPTPHVERFELLARRFEAAPAGSPERIRIRQELQTEILVLGENVRRIRDVVTDDLEQRLRSSVETSRRLAVVVAVGSFLAIALVVLFLVYRRDNLRLRRAEHALQSSEERLLGILGGMQDVVWSVTPDARIVTYVSPPATNLYGLTPRSILENPSKLLDHVHAEDRTNVREFLDRARQSPDALHEIEYRFTRPDGTRLWIQDRAWVVRGEGDDVRGLVVLSKDVTARKTAELALQSNEQKYRRIVESTADGIAVVDTTDRIVFANPGLEEIFGCPQGELVGRSLHEFVEEDQALLVHPREDRGRFDPNNQFELEVLRVDGRRRQVRVTVSPVHDDTGAFIGTLGIYRDSTELIEAQITLIRELAFLSEIEVLGRSIVGESDIRQIARDACAAAVAYGGVENAAVAFRDPQTGALSEWASTFDEAADIDPLRALLLDEQGIPGHLHGSSRDVTFHDLLDPQTPAVFRPLADLGYRALVALSVRAAGRTYGLLYGLDRRPRGYDPEETSRLRHLTILLGSALSNVTLYARTQAANIELQAAVERLREAEQAREQFYRFLIHDLNKPLAAIIGTATRIENHKDLAPALKPRVERIENAALRLRDIVDHLLAHEQVRRKELPAERLRVNLWEQILDAVRLLEERHRDLDIRLAGHPWASEQTLPRITLRANPTALNRILHNLIDNALEYAETRIEIDVANEPDAIVLSIWNDGLPISADDRQGIFKEFYRGSGNKRAGYGLGLASVKRLVELHEGEVWLDESITAGVRFCLRLPVPT